MPILRRWTNRWMSRRISRLAGRPLPDSQCGFRMLPIAMWATLDLHSTHFEIESEMVASAVRKGEPIHFVPVAVHYGNEQTKISVFADSWRWVRWWLRAGRKQVPGPVPNRVQNLLQSPPPSSKLAL